MQRAVKKRTPTTSNHRSGARKAGFALTGFLSRSPCLRAAWRAVAGISPSFHRRRGADGVVGRVGKGAGYGHPGRRRPKKALNLLQYPFALRSARASYRRTFMKTNGERSAADVVAGNGLLHRRALL